MKQYIDRPLTNNIRNLDRMVAELSPWISPMEMDSIVGFMSGITGSKFDINPSVEDSKTQLRLILGNDRFLEIVSYWNEANQKLLTSFGKRKYRRKSDGTIWDGLDPDDNESEYEKIYV